MVKAARNGHEAIVRWYHDELDGIKVNWAMALAAAEGHEALMRLCYDEWGAEDVNWAMSLAAEKGHEAICGCAMTSGAPIM